MLVLRGGITCAGISVTAPNAPGGGLTLLLLKTVGLAERKPPL
jgi:hypothetical protein